MGCLVSLFSPLLLVSRIREIWSGIILIPIAYENLQIVRQMGENDQNNADIELHASLLQLLTNISHYWCALLSVMHLFNCMETNI
jgi:hypothetical protein